MEQTIEHEISFWERFEDILVNDSFVCAFSFSCLLLIFISLMKYFFTNGINRKDFSNFFLELPIDVLTIVITIIITGCTQGEVHVMGILLVLVSILISCLCCILRRFAMNEIYAEKFSGKLIFLLLVIYIIVCAWTYFTYISLY